jgi:hypothetical protein
LLRQGEIRPRLGWVYFVASPKCERIKIGYAKKGRLARRLTEIQVASAEDLELVAAVNGTHKDERDWHRRLAHLRVRGEWFEANTEILNELAPPGAQMLLPRPLEAA